MTYSTFAPGDRPKNYPYDIAQLVTTGFTHKLSADPRNSELEQYCTEQEAAGKKISRKSNPDTGQIDVWVN